jgi:hypothetical protein
VSGRTIFLVSAALTCAFFINLCDAVFRCGCRSWWAGAAQHCNIHTPGARHCPWCSFGTGGAAVIVGVILGCQLALSLRPRRWPAAVRLTLAVFAFPVVGTALALLSGWLTGYWS